MPTLEESIVIETPIDEVFTYASDWRKWPDSHEGFTDVSPTTEIERGDGAIYAYRMWVLGLPFKAQTEIHGFVENQGWTDRRIKGVPHRTHYEFEDLDPHTKFTTTIYYSLPVPIIGPVLCSLLFNSAWRRILEESVNNLRAHFHSPDRCAREV
jgi:uncharacterized membrane protein